MNENPSRGAGDRRERRWRATDQFDRQPLRGARGLLVALLLASATLVVLDHQGGEDSAMEPARRAVGEALGPVEAGADTLTRPFVAIPQWLQSQADLRDDLTRMENENAQLRREASTSALDRNRLQAYDDLTAAAEETGRALVPARVIAYGTAQSFTRTITIDGGSSSGIAPDQTVVNADGLVGRVIRVTSSTATVLLVMDAESVVGGRIGESMEVGFLRGRDVIGDDGRLDLELLDSAIAPAEGDTVLTWGSKGGSPYLGGIPVGRVAAVYASPRETTQRAVIEPFADFSSLDLVGVAVPSGTRGDRAVVEADGSLQ